MELLLLQNLYSGVGREFGWNTLPCSHVSVGKGAGREILKFYLPEKERPYLLKLKIGIFLACPATGATPQTGGS